MSDDNLHTPDDDALEAELRSLVPSKLQPSLSQRLHDELAATSGKKSNDQKRRAWQIPLALAAVLFIFCGMIALQLNSADQDSNNIASEQFTHPPEATGPGQDRYLNEMTPIPVSSRGFLLNANSQGIIESENGLNERFELNYEDVDIWHIPGTDTSIRIFSPRQETILVPVHTD